MAGLIVETLDAEDTVVQEFAAYIASDKCSVETKTKLFDSTKWKPQYSAMESIKVLRAAVDFILNFEKKSWKQELDEIKDKKNLEAHVQKIIEEICMCAEKAAVKKPAEAGGGGGKEAGGGAAATKGAATKKTVEKKLADWVRSTAVEKAVAKKLAAAAAADDPDGPRVHKWKEEESPGKDGAGTEADFFTYCEEWIAVPKSDRGIMAKLKTFGIWQDKIPPGKIIPVYMAELIHIGVKFTENFGRGIPTTSDSTAAIRPCLEADVWVWIRDRKHNFESVFRLYMKDQITKRNEH